MKQASPKILIKGLSLFFAFALIFTQVTLQYYNVITSSEILMAEEELETEESLSSLEDIPPFFDARFNIDFVKNKTVYGTFFKTKSYQAVYLSVFSPPPDFSSIS